jgi:hypothetical protein
LEQTAAPALSAILVAPEGFDTIRNAIEHLRRQTALDQLEVVIVTPSAADLGADTTVLAAFPRVRVVEVGCLASTGAAVAAGVRCAVAPVVVYVEDHSFPEPGWAEALITAHRQPWAAVAPTVLNANPQSVVSRAEYLLGFAPWGKGVSSGIVEALPSHQTSYKREVLLQYGVDLPDLLEHEVVLHSDLQRRGYQFYHEAGAKTRHVNISLFTSYLRSAWHGNRVFADHRAHHERWPTGRRLLYVLAAPLIPLVRFRRFVAAMRQVESLRELSPGVLLLAAAGLIAATHGEVVGYLFGAGGACRQRLRLEHNRQRHVTRQDWNSACTLSVSD